MEKIIFKCATKKKTQYLDKVVKLYRQRRSMSSILHEVPFGRTTVESRITVIGNPELR